jgi:hypothetical protein
LNGMYVWEQFESVHLPRWALPTSNERFSSDGMADWYDRFKRSRAAGFAFESAYLSRNAEILL